MSADMFSLPGDDENKREEGHIRFFKRVTKATGIKFPKNCIRHTAATFLTQKQGFTETSLELGHSESVLKKHYRRAISAQETHAYFNILPETLSEHAS